MTNSGSIATMLALVLAACGGSSAKPSPPSPAASPETGARFRYDPATGTCVDSGGQAGFNPVEPAVLFPKTVAGGVTLPDGNAECVDLTGFDFSTYIGHGYTVLAGWNFRGARFTKAKFLFARMEGVDLAGADMSELGWGYTTIEGTGDKYTKRPESCPAKDKPEDIFCMR